LTLQGSFLFFFFFYFLKFSRNSPKDHDLPKQWLRCVDEIKGNSLLHWDRFRDSPGSFLCRPGAPGTSTLRSHRT
jgi:hypothetical protein